MKTRTIASSVFGTAAHRGRRVAACFVILACSALGVGVALVACGGAPNSGFSPSGADGSTNGGGPGSPGNPSNNGDGGAPIFNPVSDDGSTPGPTFTDGGCAGLQCQIANTCTNDGGTTIVGKVMDPAGANPLYNVLAYVPMFDPAQPSKIPAGYGIEPITGGVTFPSGVSCDSCSYLYTGNPIAIGTTGTDGTFTITNAPSGTNIPVVVQVGKWRTHATVSTVTSCEQADAGSINMPSSVPASDPIVSMPQIAISMGGADSLECLPYRMGINLSEFTSGASASGHIHVFTGGGGIGGIIPGTPPSSSANMWNSLADLEKYDVSLFSCEGSETAAANPPILESYVNAGGRAFLSHYHYAWLAGPLETGSTAGYSANADWGGSILASWNSNDQGADEGAIIGAKISTTLNVGGGTFAKGEDLEAWLSNVGALGTSGVASDEVAVNSPAFDPNVTSSNVYSQPWATYDTTTTTDDGFPTAYFSFDTPINAVATTDGGAPPYCGRVVFSGLHVGAAASDTTGGALMPSSTTCNPGPGDLSPQEKVLEFMLFDLSACVTPDKAAPGIPIPPPPPPPPPK
ncbi:MAG: hypothetical protein ACLQBL_01595 [Polyangiaceae bacterium]